MMCNRAHSIVPSPLVGEGQGGGDCRTSIVGIPPTPNPSPQGGGEVRVVTLGCRLNAFESEVMRGHAERAGLDDAVIVNTCAVTAEAVRQAAQTIRKLKRKNPGARVIVTGC